MQVIQNSKPFGRPDDCANVASKELSKRTTCDMPFVEESHSPTWPLAKPALQAWWARWQPQPQNKFEMLSTFTQQLSSTIGLVTKLTSCTKTPSHLPSQHLFDDYDDCGGILQSNDETLEAVARVERKEQSLSLHFGTDWTHTHTKHDNVMPWNV